MAEQANSQGRAQKPGSIEQAAWNKRYPRKSFDERAIEKASKTLDNLGISGFGQKEIDELLETGETHFAYKTAKGEEKDILIKLIRLDPSQSEREQRLTNPGVVFIQGKKRFRIPVPPDRVYKPPTEERNLSEAPPPAQPAMRAQNLPKTPQEDRPTQPERQPAAQKNSPLQDENGPLQDTDRSIIERHVKTRTAVQNLKPFIYESESGKFYHVAPPIAYGEETKIRPLTGNPNMTSLDYFRGREAVDPDAAGKAQAPATTSRTAPVTRTTATQQETRDTGGRRAIVGHGDTEVLEYDPKVAELQRALLATGDPVYEKILTYTDARGENGRAVDGLEGRRTRAAARYYAQAHGLNAREMSLDDFINHIKENSPGTGNTLKDSAAPSHTGTRIAHDSTAAERPDTPLQEYSVEQEGLYNAAAQKAHMFNLLKKLFQEHAANAKAEPEKLPEPPEERIENIDRAKTMDLGT